MEFENQQTQKTAKKVLNTILIMQSRQKIELKSTTYQNQVINSVNSCIGFYQSNEDVQLQNHQIEIENLEQSVNQISQPDNPIPELSFSSIKQQNKIANLSNYKKRVEQKILSSTRNITRFSSRETKNCIKFALRLFRQNGNIEELLNDALKQDKVLRGQYYKIRILAAMLELRQKSKKTLELITKDYDVDLSSMAQLAQLFGSQNSSKARRQLSQILSAKLKSEVLYNQNLRDNSKKKIYYVFCKLLNLRCLSPRIWRTFTLLPQRL